MKDRLKNLRKKLDLTQEEFAKKIGIKRNTLANYEIGRNEPIDGIIFSICREFNVNENWLRTGEGEMFDQPDTFSLDAYAKEKNMSGLDLLLIKCYLDMPKEMRLTFMNHLKESLVAADELAFTEKSDSQSQRRDNDEFTEDFDFDAEEAFLEAVRQEYRKEKSTALSASQTTDLGNSKEKKIS